MTIHAIILTSDQSWLPLLIGGRVSIIRKLHFQLTRVQNFWQTLPNFIRVYIVSRKSTHLRRIRPNRSSCGFAPQQHVAVTNLTILLTVTTELQETRINDRTLHETNGWWKSSQLIWHFQSRAYARLSCCRLVFTSQLQSKNRFYTCGSSWAIPA